MLICSTSTRHEIDWYPAEKNEKENRHDDRQFCNQIVVAGMIQAKRLQHTPKAMIEMDGKRYKTEEIKEAIEKMTQSLLHSNAYGNFSRCCEIKSENVDDEEEENNQAGIRHSG